MTHLHCQVRFTDYAKWRASMKADADAQQDAGIFVIHLWRAIEDPGMAFFVCEIQDKDKARAFLNPTDLAEAEKQAGASDFQWHFVEDVTFG
jgi:hypothetical protein